MIYKSEEKNIGLFAATNIGVGAIVGGGFLALAGVAFVKAGPSAIVAFVLNGIVAYITALSFAQMSVSFPESGGTYTFTKKVFHVRASFAVGWILWFASIMASVLYAMGVASYSISAIQSLYQTFAGTMPVWINSRPMIIMISAGVTIFYALQIAHRTGQGSQWETVGKLILFSILIIVGIFFLFRQPFKIIHTRLTPFFGGGINGILQAMGYTVITFQGFDLIAAVAGKVQNPERNIPLSMFVSISIALLIYIPFLFIISIIGVRPGESIVALSLKHPETVVAIAVRNYLGSVGYWLIVVAAILSMLSALYSNILAASHIAMAMSRDRTLPRFLSNIKRAVYASALIIIVAIMIVPDLPAAGATASLIFLICFTLVHITNILTRMRGGYSKGTLLKASFPFVPVVGMIICGLFAIFQGIAVPEAGRTLSIWLALGFFLYFALLADRAEVVDAMEKASNPDLSRLRGQSPLVLVPLANPYRAKAMVQVANALSNPQVGRSLLLFIVTGSIGDTTQIPSKLISTQNVIQEALTASYGSGLAPEALITVAPIACPEIIRVANVYRCESLLIGLTDLEKDTINPDLEELIHKVNCDIVFFKAPPDWQLSQVERILVPVGGRGGHDELRARLLGSLCRYLKPEVIFLKVVKQNMTEKEYALIRHKLTKFAEDEAPLQPSTDLIRSSNVIDGVRDYARASDLVILGIQRLGRRRKVFGKISLEITRSIKGATILISRRG
ncbi:MAG: APC family permease [bacterium]